MALFIAGAPNPSAVTATGTLFGRTSADRFGELYVNVKDMGAIGDGTAHYLNERYPTLAAARLDYPFATNKDTETIDKCAIQHAMNYWAWYRHQGRSVDNRGAVFLPPGDYVTDGPIYTWGHVYSNTLTYSVGPPTTFHMTGHGLTYGDRVYVIGFPSGELNSGLGYFVMADGLTANDFQLSSTLGGLVTNVSTAGLSIYLMIKIAGGGKLWANQGTAVIRGNFDGFLLDNPSVPSTSVAGSVEGVYFINTHANGGCLRCYQDSFKVVRDCYFTGHYGAVFQGEGGAEGSIDGSFENCGFQGLGSEPLTPEHPGFDDNGVGLILGPNQKVYNCTFFSWDTGLMAGGSQCVVRSSRFETNNVAMRLGRYPNFDEPLNETSNAFLGGIVENISFESNVVDMKITGANGLVIRNIISQLNVTSGTAEIPPHLGVTSLWFFAPVDVTVERWTCAGLGTPPKGGIYFEGGFGTTHANTRSITFIDCVNGHGFFDDSSPAGGTGGTGSNAGMETIRSRGAGIAQIASTLAQLNAYATTGYAALGTKRWCSNADQVVGTAPWGTEITIVGAANQTVPVWLSAGLKWRLGN